MTDNRTLIANLRRAVERDDAVLGRGRLRGGIERRDRSTSAVVQYAGISYEAVDTYAETTLYSGSNEWRSK